MDAAIFPTMLSLSQLPASPPPDHKLFFNNNNKTHPSACPTTSQTPAAVLANPLLIKSFAREMEAPAVKKAPSLLEKHYSTRPQAQTQTSQQPFTIPKEPDTPTSSTSASSRMDSKVPSPSHIPQPQPQQQQQPERPFSSPPGNPFLHLADPAAAGLSATDPKHVQMVSRMASYYQQRCQAILNFQQQRCQTWAASHRQKCQETMQAAMLVVAWYIRDRIGRRRRRNRRAFRRGLREKNTAAVMRRVPKGESVRKWVMDIPDASAPPSLDALMNMAPSHHQLGDGPPRPVVLDAEERSFDVEKEAQPDKDSQLFAVADQMIKSQLAKIDVPLLGALNLDESDSETEDEDEDKYYYEPEDYDMEEGENEEEYDDDEDDLEYDDDDDDSYVEDEASKEAMHGTGKGSLKRKRADSTSGVDS